MKDVRRLYPCLWNHPSPPSNGFPTTKGKDEPDDSLTPSSDILLRGWCVFFLLRKPVGGMLLFFPRCKLDPLTCSIFFIILPKNMRFFCYFSLAGVSGSTLNFLSQKRGIKAHRRASAGNWNLIFQASRSRSRLYLKKTFGGQPLL